MALSQKNSARCNSTASLRFANCHTSVVSCAVDAPKDGRETLGTEMLGGEGTAGSEGALETAGSTAF